LILRQEWRNESNLAYSRGDIWWSVALIIWGLSIVRRWQDDGDIMARNIWFVAHFLFCAAPILWKLNNPKTYIKYRISLLATLRCLRAVGVILVLSKNQNYIWKPASRQLGCLLDLFVSQHMKLAYLLCQVLAYQVPLVHHIWLILLNGLAVLMSVPGRCQAECSLSTDFSDCSMKWLEKLAVLDKYWIFSATNPASMGNDIEPWQACTIIQCLMAVRWILGVSLLFLKKNLFIPISQFSVHILQILFAVGPPLMYHATVEEHSRKQFLLWRGGIPLIYDLKITLFYDTLLSLLAVSIAYTAISLVSGH